MLIILSKCWSTLLYTSSDTVSLRIELVQKIQQKNNNRKETGFQIKMLTFSFVYLPKYDFVNIFFVKDYQTLFYDKNCLLFSFIFISYQILLFTVHVCTL